MQRTIRSLLFAVSLFGLAAAAHAAPASPPLTGVWTLHSPAVDASGQPCPFVPDRFEFFSDGTVAMSNMPGGRIPYRTELTPEERNAVLGRQPDLKGKKVLLMRLSPQMDWAATPMMYGYAIAGNELTLTVPGWSPAKFKRGK